MGKRKRRTDPNRASTSDVLPHSSQMDTSPQQESSPQVENSASTPIATILELVDGSVKLQKLSQHRLSRVMYLRNPSLYARKYSRRNTSSHADASTSHAKVIPLHDGNEISKMAINDNEISRTANRSRSDDFELQTESLARAIQNPEGIRLTPLSTVAPSHNMGTTCSICEQLLRKKPDGGPFSHFEPSVVAVLICGHLYHADCLEEITSQEERTDPSCPLCQSL